MSPAERFLADLAATRAMRRGLLSPDRVVLEMKALGTATVCLSRIKAVVRGRGDGWGALSKIIWLADRHGVDISLLAVPNYDAGPARDPAAAAAFARLHAFYRAFGFVCASGDVTAAEASMVRPHGGTCLLDRPEFRFLVDRIATGSPDPRVAAVERHLERLFGSEEVALAIEMTLESALEASGAHEPAPLAMTA